MAKDILIHTIQMSNWRIAKERSIPLLDITAKSRTSVFSPDYNAVMGYKAGDISNELYTEIYTSKMRNSLINYRSEWNKLLQMDSIALACYCKPNTFCHRHLFANMLILFAKANGCNPILIGEILK